MTKPQTLIITEQHLDAAVREAEDIGWRQDTCLVAQAGREIGPVNTANPRRIWFKDGSCLEFPIEEGNRISEVMNIFDDTFHPSRSKAQRAKRPEILALIRSRLPLTVMGELETKP